jgi:GNAT superfamily N-acetyltransferase
MTTATAHRTHAAAASLVIGTARLDADLTAAAELLGRQLRWVAAVSASAAAADEVARLSQPEDGVRLLLARKGGRPVGVARVRFRRPGETGAPGACCAQLTHLYVVPEARGCGVGEALVSQAGVMAWWFGCGELRAVVASWTADAVQLVRRVGMLPVAEGTLAMSVAPDQR